MGPWRSKQQAGSGESTGGSQHGTGRQSPAEAAPWAVTEFLPFPVLEQGGQLTATDLLGFWFRPPTRNGPDWGGFFSQGSGGVPQPDPSSQHQGPPGPPVPPPVPSSPREHLRSWTMARALVRSDETYLVDQQAEGALDCLYEFLHAIERRDVEAAMDYVAEDYHSMEQDREVTKADLQVRVEKLLAWVGDADMQVGLTTVPEALFHQVGVLVFAEIQVDACSADGEKRTHLDERLAILKQQANGGWAISALSATRGSRTDSGDTD